ncbi:MAG: hypothetical protein ACRDT0_16820 [Pseudonocardiaceae bacterium]
MRAISGPGVRWALSTLDRQRHALRDDAATRSAWRVMTPAGRRLSAVFPVPGGRSAFQRRPAATSGRAGSEVGSHAGWPRADGGG